MTLYHTKKQKKTKTTNYVYLNLAFLWEMLYKMLFLPCFLFVGYIIFFSVLSNILENLGIFIGLSNLFSPLLNLLHIPTAYFESIIKGLLEVTNGLRNLTNTSLENGIIEICIAAFLLGFGGISVLMQVSSIVSDNDLSLKAYIFGKILHGLLASLFTYFILKYTNLFSIVTLPVFSYSNSSMLPIINETSNLISVLSGLTLLAIFFKVISILKKNNN